MICAVVQEVTQKILSKKAFENYWVGSPFEEIVALDSDTRGKWGETILFEFLTKYTKLDLTWDKDFNSNTADGVYDMFFTRKKPKKKVRIEGKTAGRGKSKTWQHENIYASEAWDKLVLLDFDYSTLWLTVVDYSEMVFDKKHPVFERKPHLRKDETDKYKWDFSLRQLELGAVAGFSYCHNVLNPDCKKLSSFLNQKLS